MPHVKSRNPFLYTWNCEAVGFDIGSSRHNCVFTSNFHFRVVVEM